MFGAKNRKSSDVGKADPSGPVLPVRRSADPPRRKQTSQRFNQTAGETPEVQEAQELTAHSPHDGSWL